MSIPSIKDQIMTPADKFVGTDGKDINTLLVPDGSVVDKAKYPELWGKTPSSGNRLSAEYLGVAFSIIDPISDFLGITTTKKNLWILSRAKKEVHEYTSVGVKTGRVIDFSGEQQLATDCCYREEHIYVVGNTPKMCHKYKLDGTYTGVSFPLAYTGTTIAHEARKDVFLVCQSGVTYEYTIDGTYVKQLLSNATCSGLVVNDTSVLYADNSASLLIERDLNDLTKTISSHAMVEPSITHGVTVLNNKIYTVLYTKNDILNYDGWYEERKLPTLTDKDSSCPYKVVADLHRFKIGEEIRSYKDKYQEDGVNKYDALVQDGSAVDKATHPVLWNKLYDSGEDISKRKFPPFNASFGVALQADNKDSVGSATVITDTSLGFSDKGADLTGDARIVYDATNISTSGSFAIACSCSRPAEQYWGTFGFNGDSQGGWGTSRFDIYVSGNAPTYNARGTVITNNGDGAKYLDIALSMPTIGEEVVFVLQFNAIDSTLIFSCYEPNGVLLDSKSVTVAGTITIASKTNMTLGYMPGVNGGGHYRWCCAWDRLITKSDIFSAERMVSLPNKPTTDSRATYRIIGDLT